MSTNTELQALLSKMGGTPTEQDTNSDLIKKINQVYESGGSGGGSTEESPYFYVRFTQAGVSEETGLFILSADKTFAEISAAIESKILVGIASGIMNAPYAMQLSFSGPLSMTNQAPTFVYDAILPDSENYYIIRLTVSVDENDEVTYGEEMIPFGLPAITDPSMEGYVPTVSRSGTVVWAPVPVELPSHADASDGDTLQVTGNGGLRWGDAEVSHEN